MSRANRLAAACLALLAACRSHHPPSAAPRVGPALAAALAAADHARAPWRCAAADLPALPDGELAAGTGRWKLHGHALERQSPTGGAVTIAVIADAGGAAPATLAALARLRAQLDRAAPDVVLALGGMGGSQADLEATLGVLAAHASFLVIALPGDLEPVAAEAAAVATLHGRGDPVVDGRLVRSLELPGATIATIPGAGASGRLVAGADGCAWAPADPAAIYGELAARPGLRIAATSEAPRETLGGEPSGERALVPPPAAVDVVLHGPTRPAATRATSGGRDGKAIALAPGTSDATPRLPDPHVPSAGLLVVHGTSWTWRPLVDSPGSR